MVLAELGQRISKALGSLNTVTVVDEAVRWGSDGTVVHCAALWCTAHVPRRPSAPHPPALATTHPPALPSAHPPPSQVLDGVLKEIATALLQADVNVRLVANLRCAAAPMACCACRLWLHLPMAGRVPRQQSGGSRQQAAGWGRAAERLRRLRRPAAHSHLRCPALRALPCAAATM